MRGSSTPPLAFVISGKSPKKLPGGLAAYAINTAKILADLGYRVYIIAFGQDDEEVDLGFATLVHVRTPWNKLVSLGLLMIAPYLERAMRRIWERDRPAEVVVYSAGLWGKAGVAFKKALAGRPVRVTTLVGYFSTFDHDSKGQVIGSPAADYGWGPHLFMWSVHLFSKWFYGPIEHRMLRSHDRVVVHYESTRSILLREVRRLPAGQIAKIPYYIDLYDRESGTGFDERYVTDPAQPTVVVICRQDPRKGINTFLKAVKLAHDAGARFNCLVVGSGIFLPHNRSLAERLGIGTRVKFLGFVDRVEPVLNAADVYVLPSVEEGSGAISLLEAMKKGVAILTTRCDGIPEDFIEGETGLLVDPGDEQQMAAALTRLVREPELRQKLARQVGLDYAQRFTFEKMKKGVASLLS